MVIVEDNLNNAHVLCKEKQDRDKFIFNTVKILFDGMCRYYKGSSLEELEEIKNFLIEDNIEKIDKAIRAAPDAAMFVNLSNDKKIKSAHILYTLIEQYLIRRERTK